MNRSFRHEVRNPMLTLPAVLRLRGFPLDVRRALADVLDELRSDAAIRAEHSWRHHKGPMAAYWKAVSVYARHLGRALRRR